MILNRIKFHIYRSPNIKRVYLWATRCSSPFIRLINLSSIFKYVGFFIDWLKYRARGGESKLLDWYPCLFDKTASTSIDPQYFYQAVWAMKRIISSSINKHVDIGSDVQFVGMLTAGVNVEFVDIRPLDVNIKGLSCKKGSLLELPYNKSEVLSLSCLHVIEHIGLGRYGDPIDPLGSVKACKELIRVLSNKGKLYLSTPICNEQKVQFNGQRVFEIKNILDMFSDLHLVELSIVDSRGKYLENVQSDYVPLEHKNGSDFELGLFIFEKVFD